MVIIADDSHLIIKVMLVKTLWYNLKIDQPTHIHDFEAVQAITGQSAMK